MTEHLTDCGLYLFRYLRQLQVDACCEGSFPLQVRRRGTLRLAGILGVHSARPLVSMEWRRPCRVEKGHALAPLRHLGLTHRCEP